jgi:nucleoside-diphosphate-sugar epimerase
MRVLLIGGRGFIGPCIIEQLQRAGHDVILFDRGGRPDLFTNLEHIQGDRQHLADYAAALRKAQPDVVIDVVLSNGRQAAELMTTFRGIARRVVALSSMDVYRACGVLHGLEPGPLQAVPLTEESELRTKLQTYSAETIASARKIVNWLDDEYDKIPVEKAVMSDPETPGTVLRLPFVYGPRDMFSRLLPIVKRVADGRKAILLDEQVAQWRAPRGYVENVAAAIVLAATSDQAARRIYNVAEEPAYSELEWTRKVANAAGWRGEISVVPSSLCPEHLKMPGNLQQHWVPDSGRIRRELGYREVVPLEDALKATIAWLREHPPQFDAGKFDYAAEDAWLERRADKAG